MATNLYLDGKEHESEIKQVLGDTFSSHDLSYDDVIVLGDTFSSHDLSDDDVIIIGRQGLLISGRGDDVITIGRQGLLISGRGCARYEPLLISYMTMICRERFVK
ncbi:hypothetical protein T484DRAFT_1789051 [Baffinella frigidus]|nr:hypothetical protein T484DRAFT_1789051 [Cryptophyta sp. CCMP2293]